MFCKMNLHWDIFLLVFMGKEFNFLLNCNGDDNAEMNSMILYLMIESLLKSVYHMVDFLSRKQKRNSNSTISSNS